MKKVKSTKGFTLVEVVLSLAIVAIMFTIFQASVFTILINRRVKNQELALRIANKKMEEIRSLTYETLPTSTTFSDALLSSLPLSQATLATSSYNSRTAQVTVNVVWREFNGTATHTISLTTLVTQGGL